MAPPSARTQGASLNRQGDQATGHRSRLPAVQVKSACAPATETVPLSARSNRKRIAGAKKPSARRHTSRNAGTETSVTGVTPGVSPAPAPIDQPQECERASPSPSGSDSEARE